jgi:hypothetical protein
MSNIVHLETHILHFSTICCNLAFQIAAGLIDKCLMVVDGGTFNHCLELSINNLVNVLRIVGRLICKRGVDSLYNVLRICGRLI